VCPKKVFKIKACPGSSPYIVIQISDNEGLLENLEKQFGLGEVYKLMIVINILKFL
jgi:hypothetical protein